MIKYVQGIVFFDCDETLWTSDDKDRIGSAEGPFEKINAHQIRRASDAKLFTIKSDIKEVLGAVKERGYTLGIISDNIAEQVATVLGLFGLTHYFDEKYISVSLREGTGQSCPKDQMIKDVLDKNGGNIFQKVILVDDKDYEKTMHDSGYEYLRSQGNSLKDSVTPLLEE